MIKTCYTCGEKLNWEEKIEPIKDTVIGLLVGYSCKTCFTKGMVKEYFRLLESTYKSYSKFDQK